MNPDFSFVWKTLTPVTLPAPLADAPSLEIWFADLSALATCIRDLAALLDDSERTELARLHLPDDRRRMTLRRGIRRVVLAAHLAVSPDILRFLRGPFGKPLLPKTDWRFSMSSSGNGCLLVLARGTEIGVDLEDVADFRLTPGLVQMVCNATEWRCLDALPATARLTGFLRLWTAKEAVLKLRGIGFHQQTDVPRLLFDLQPAEHVFDLTLDAGWVASLAVAGVIRA